MMKTLLAKLLPILYFFTTAVSPNCVQHTYSIFASPLRRSIRSENLLDDILCTNITADLVLDVAYEIKSHPQHLWIRDSHIPKLPANSSLSRFTHINGLMIIDVDLEEVEPGAFNGLVQLRELNLGVNKLRKISSGTFANLGDLESLHLHMNRIKVIEEDGFLGLSKLTMLRLNGNKLTVLDGKLFRDLINLEDLWISENPLRQFHANFSKLRTIVAIHTDLETVDVDFTKSPLELIKFTEGQLEEVDFGKLPATELVQFEENRIVTVQNWDKLNCGRAFLYQNKISAFDISENVVGLFLKHNQIESIVNTFLGRNKKLEHLDLAFNRISEISSDLFRGLSQLQSLNLGHNQISVLHSNTFVNCPSLQDLDLSSNQIESLAPNAFSGIANLASLDISGNKLKTLKTPELSELKKGVVSIGSTEITWDYVKTLINNSEDLSLQLGQRYWDCDNSALLISKRNVENITCHYTNTDNLV